MSKTLITTNVDIPLLRANRGLLAQMRRYETDEEYVDTLAEVISVLDHMIDNHDKANAQSNDPGPLDTLALKHHGLLSDIEADALIAGKEELPESRKFEVESSLEAYLHASGAKDDEGKLRAGLVLGGFNGALTEVCRVGTYGANKYSDDGWRHVPDGKKRYMDAAMRHLLDYMSGKEFNYEDGNVRHLAQVIWNFCCILEFDLAEDQMHQVESEFGGSANGKSDCND